MKRAKCKRAGRFIIICKGNVSAEIEFVYSDYSSIHSVFRKIRQSIRECDCPRIYIYGTQALGPKFQTQPADVNHIRRATT